MQGDMQDLVLQRWGGHWGGVRVHVRVGLCMQGGAGIGFADGGGTGAVCACMCVWGCARREMQELLWTHGAVCACMCVWGCARREVQELQRRHGDQLDAANARCAELEAANRKLRDIKYELDTKVRCAPCALHVMCVVCDVRSANHTQRNTKHELDIEMRCTPCACCVRWTQMWMVRGAT